MCKLKNTFLLSGRINFQINFQINFHINFCESAFDIEENDKMSLRVYC